MTNTMAIGRGWAVITSDGKRVGDVIEVHDHYLLVSRGVIFVRDRYLPLGTVDRVEEKRVILTVTEDMFRKMDLSHIPPPPIVEPSTEPLAQPMPVTDVDPTYMPQPYEADAGNYSTGWQSDAGADYDETPSYTPAQPNGLIQIEHGLNLAYTEIGYGQPIVLVPGWPFDSAVWEPLPTVLAEDYRVVTYDPRGTGKSDAPWDYYSVDAMAGDLHRLIVEQALYEVTLVAWSTGAVVALAYARTFPKRISRLVLVAPVVLRWPEPPEAGDVAEESSEEPSLADEPAERSAKEPSPADEPAQEFPEEPSPMAEADEVLRDEEWEGEDPITRQSGEPSILDESIQESWATQLLEDRPALFRLLVEELAGPELSEPHRHWLWERLMLGGHHAHIKTWEAIRTYDLTDSCTDVRTPVTIV
ncbi:MAG: alpha/beta fold hydrolase, partial [Chloroflexota bacterium]